MYVWHNNPLFGCFSRNWHSTTICIFKINNFLIKYFKGKWRYSLGKMDRKFTKLFTSMLGSKKYWKIIILCAMFWLYVFIGYWNGCFEGWNFFRNIFGTNCFKLMSCAFSFGRMGLDFRSLIHYKFSQMVLNIFQNKIEAATKRSILIFWFSNVFNWNSWNDSWKNEVFSMFPTNIFETNNF